MKFKSLFLILLVSVSSQNLFANGVIVIDAATGEYFKLIKSAVDVSINNQVATVITTQLFENNSGADQTPKFAFPLAEDASAISLKWKIGGIWFNADFSPSPQDTVLPGSGGSGNSIDIDLESYLGGTGLYLDFKQMIPADTFVLVELTYVQLLPYNFNKVDFTYPNDYSLIQSTQIDSQRLSVELSSLRTIDQIDLLSHLGANVVHTGNNASLDYILTNSPADENFHLEYELNSNQLGLFSLSTFIPDSSLECDDYGKGFFAFIVEPDPSDNNIIDKVFTLVIDRSGSMSGNKIVQARDAASFIVNNLNMGDKFNIVDFANSATAFKTDHVDYNATTMSQALNYINGISSGGGTSMDESFQLSIPQFANSNPNEANILIFFTDGHANGTISSTQGLLNLVDNLKQQHNINDLSIFTFGIGSNVNQQLLTQLAVQNNGLAEYLGANQLLDKITDFYLTIQNPVLLNIQMNFDPPIVLQTYPQPLPNLYKGQQLIVVGRYLNSDSVEVTLQGTAFGNTQTYNYNFFLTDQEVQEYQFLPKIWAKKRMSHLMNEYYVNGVGTVTSDSLKDIVTNTSLCYGVLSPFTSFTNDNPYNPTGNSAPVGLEETEWEDNLFETTLISSYPNPFTHQTTITLQVNEELYEVVYLNIYDIFGRMINSIPVVLTGKGEYEVVLNSSSFSEELPAGNYFYQLQLNEQNLTGMITKL